MTDEKVPRRLRLQPAERIDNLWQAPNGDIAVGRQLPYPYYVSEDGSIYDPYDGKLESGRRR